MKIRLPDCVWPVNAELGEGPVWHAAKNAVYFVDIKGRYSHRLSVATGLDRVEGVVAGRASAAAAAAGGRPLFVSLARAGAAAGAVSMGLRAMNGT